MPIDLEMWASLAITCGHEYVNRHFGDIRLLADTAKEAKEVRAFLESPHPYDTISIRTAVEETLADSLRDMRPAPGKNRIVFLAGPLGSKQFLLDRVNDAGNHNTYIEELRQLCERALRSDISRHRESFAAHSSERLEPYAKWRGLMSGIDQTILAIARMYRLNLVKDDTLTGFNPAEIRENIDLVKNNIGADEVHIYAVLLTPDESAAEAGRLGMPPDEARLTAQEFARQWEDLSGVAPNITILTPDLEPVYVQRNSIVVEPLRPDLARRVEAQPPRDVA